MKKRKLLLIGAVEACVLLLGVYFEPTLCVRGYLHGEAFFDGKSTSWWRRELERWEISGAIVYQMDNEPATIFRIPMYSCQPTWFEQMQERCLGRKIDEGRPFPRPKLLDGGPDAIPVLEALLDDPAPRISRFARIGLGLDPEFFFNPQPKGTYVGHVLQWK